MGEEHADYIKRANDIIELCKAKSKRKADTDSSLVLGIINYSELEDGEYFSFVSFLLSEIKGLKLIVFTGGSEEESESEPRENSTLPAGAEVFVGSLYSFMGSVDFILTLDNQDSNVRNFVKTTNKKIFIFEKELKDFKSTIGEYIDKEFIENSKNPEKICYVLGLDAERILNDGFSLHRAYIDHYSKNGSERAAVVAVEEFYQIYMKDLNNGLKLLIKTLAENPVFKAVYEELFFKLSRPVGEKESLQADNFKALLGIK